MLKILALTVRLQNMKKRSEPGAPMVPDLVQFLKRFGFEHSASHSSSG